MAAMICSDGWIAGEKSGDGEIRAIGDGRYEIRIVRLIPRPVDPARAAPLVSGAGEGTHRAGGSRAGFPLSRPPAARGGRGSVDPLSRETSA